MFQPIRGQGGHLVFSDWPENANLVEDVEILLPLIRSEVSEEKSKTSQSIRGQGGYLVFPIGPDHTKLERER